MTELQNQIEDIREQEIFQRAYQLFNRKPNWVTFFREILGVSGAVRAMYDTKDDMAQFEQTETYGAIQQMLSKLRENDSAEIEKPEPTRVITVRLPKSLHELLREEAYEHRTSVNKLCISKLVQVIDDEFVPKES